MMSGVPLETCWAFSKFWNNKFYYKVHLVGYFYWLTDSFCPGTSASTWEPHVFTHKIEAVHFCEISNCYWLVWKPKKQLSFEQLPPWNPAIPLIVHGCRVSLYLVLRLQMCCLQQLCIPETGCLCFSFPNVCEDSREYHCENYKHRSSGVCSKRAAYPRDCMAEGWWQWLSSRKRATHARDANGWCVFHTEREDGGHGYLQLYCSESGWNDHCKCILNSWRSVSMYWLLFILTDKLHCILCYLPANCRCYIQCAMELIFPA